MFPTFLPISYAELGKATMHYVKQKAAPGRRRLLLSHIALFLFRCVFQPFQNGEDEGSRKEAGDNKYTPQVPQLDFFPEEASDKE